MILFSASFLTASVPLRFEIRSQRHYGPKLLRKCMWGTGTLTPKNQREQKRPSQKGKSSNIYWAKTVTSRGCHDMSWRKLGRPAWINIFFSTCQFVRGKARDKGISCLYSLHYPDCHQPLMVFVRFLTSFSLWNWQWLEITRNTMPTLGPRSWIVRVLFIPTNGLKCSMLHGHQEQGQAGQAQSSTLWDARRLVAAWERGLCGAAGWAFLQSLGGKASFHWKSRATFAFEVFRDIDRLICPCWKLKI